MGSVVRDSPGGAHQCMDRVKLSDVKRGQLCAGRSYLFEQAAATWEECDERLAFDGGGRRRIEAEEGRKEEPVEPLPLLASGRLLKLGEYRFDLGDHITHTSAPVRSAASIARMGTACSSISRSLSESWDTAALRASLARLSAS